MKRSPTTIIFDVHISSKFQKFFDNIILSVVHSPVKWPYIVEITLLLIYHILITFNKSDNFYNKMELLQSQAPAEREL